MTDNEKTQAAYKCGPDDLCAICRREPPPINSRFHGAAPRLRLEPDHTDWLFIAARPREGAFNYEAQYICPTCTPRALAAIRVLREATPKVDLSPAKSFPDDYDLLAADE